MGSRYSLPELLRMYYTGRITEDRKERGMATDPEAEVQENPPFTGGLGRTRGWEELGMGEKIERMRAIVCSLRDDLGELQLRLSVLEQHQHGAGGVLVAAHVAWQPRVPTGENDPFF